LHLLAKLNRFLKGPWAVDPLPLAQWRLYYADAFDRDSSPRLELEGVGLAEGLTELWARHLFECIQVSGVWGFATFYLSWLEPEVGVVKHVEISRQSRAKEQLRLRHWVFGDKRRLYQGYLAEGDEALLKRLGLAHTRLLAQGGCTEDILVVLGQSQKVKDFAAKLKKTGTKSEYK
jgi:hypothetical protein